MGAPALRLRSLGDALFLDIPYIVDSAWRHIDYRLNRLHRFSVPTPPSAPAMPVARPYAALPPFFFLLLVLLYVIYGPTLRSLCGVFGHDGVHTLRVASGWLLGIGAALAEAAVLLLLHGRIVKRFSRAAIDNHDLEIGEDWSAITVNADIPAAMFVWKPPKGWKQSRAQPGRLAAETGHQGSDFNLAGSTGSGSSCPTSAARSCGSTCGGPADRPCPRKKCHLQELYAKYHPGLVILGLNVSDDRKVALDMLRSNGVTFPNILDDSPAA